MSRHYCNCGNALAEGEDVCSMCSEEIDGKDGLYLAMLVEKQRSLYEDGFQHVQRQIDRGEAIEPKINYSIG